MKKYLFIKEFGVPVSLCHKKYYFSTTNIFKSTILSCLHLLYEEVKYCKVIGELKDLVITPKWLVLYTKDITIFTTWRIDPKIKMDCFVIYFEL